DRVITRGWRILRECGSERVEVRESGRDGRDRVPRDDLVRLRRRVLEPDLPVGLERDQLVLSLDLVHGREVGGAVDLGAAGEPDVLVGGVDAMQPGRQLPVKLRADDRVVAGAVAGRAGANV